ncbi:MAG: hypothetical protein IJQ80_07730, partial [Clostridia bacterium]|nr:hypothetical protein [Clostridia bacterium]
MTVIIENATKTEGEDDPDFVYSVTDEDGNAVDPDELGLKIIRVDGEENGDYHVIAVIENDNYTLDEEHSTGATLSIIPEPEPAPGEDDPEEPADDPEEPEEPSDDPEEKPED